MEIRNVTQFLNFIASNGLTNLDGSFITLQQCLARYSSSCNCHKVQDKIKLYAECNKIYSNIVNSVLPKFKNVVLPKVPEGRISFYLDNGSLITILSR